MADFLTRMTQRTLGLLPVVQPIIASKYGSESTDAYMPGGAAPIDPDQAMEESFEDWGGMAERVAPAPVSQPVVPSGVRAPSTPVHGAPPSSPLPQGQPSAPMVQQTKPAPIRPDEVQPLRETAGGAELPGRGQAPPLPYTKPNPTLIGGEAGPAPVLEIQENQPFSSAPTASNVPATKPRRGRAKPSSGSDVGTQFIASRSGDALVPPQSGEIPQFDQTPGVGTRFTASRTSDPLVSVPSGELPQIDQKPDVGTRFTASRSATHNEGNLVSTSLSPIPANTGGNPSAKGEGIASARHANIAPERVLTGEGKPAPLPYTKHDTDPFRIGAGLVPALVSSPPPPPHMKRDPDPYSGDRMPTRGIPTSEAAPYPTPHQPFPSRGREGGVRRNVVTPLVGVREQAYSNMSGSEVEPLFPPVYPSVQDRRTATTATGKGEAAQQAESHDAPTIRVTIGRIDVRAVAPTPPASPALTKSNRSRPALSLSDYLKQRKGDQQ